MRHAEFLNRDDELTALERCWNSDRSELVIVHGRRRVGKTNLLARFAEGKPAVYLEATDLRPLDQLRDLAVELGELMDVPDDAQLDIPDWPTALALIQRRAEDGPLLVVLDEYQHLERQSPGLGSVLSRWWRTVGRTVPIMLVLAGSDVAFFADDVLGATAPLHGRRTAELRLRSFRFPDAGLFTPSWSPDDRVRSYAVWGGTPYYLDLLDERGTLRSNLIDTVFDPHAPLAHEVDHLLRLESSLRDVAMYGSILRAIASGAGNPKRIGDRIGPSTDPGNLSRQLSKLEAAGLVTREAPVVHGNARNGRYQLADNFLRFWYQFVAPAGARLATRERATRYVVEQVLPRLDEFVSAPAFEEICRAHMLDHLQCSDTGRWWGPMQDPTTTQRRTIQREIDVVGVDEHGDVVGIGACKWTRARMSKAEVVKTIDIARHLSPGRPPRIALYSRSGVSTAAQPLIDEHGVEVFDSAAMLAA